jgi:hypothetical protein
MQPKIQCLPRICIAVLHERGAVTACRWRALVLCIIRILWTKITHPKSADEGLGEVDLHMILQNKVRSSQLPAIEHGFQIQIASLIILLKNYKS